MNNTTADYLDQLEQDRSDLVDNLETQGITGLTGDETFTELVPEVLNISGGGGADLSEYFTTTVSSGNSSKSGIVNTLIKIPDNVTVTGTSLAYAFANCNNLTTVPYMDTSRVTNMQNCFAYCNHLQSVPLFNTSNVTNMSSFLNCSSSGNGYITEIPQFDLRNCTNISNIFNGLNNLTTLPVFNIPKVTSMNNMFRTDFYASKLTDESLNNLLATLLTATAYTGIKTLKTIGLTAEQTNTCTSLSNWSALQSAGWTTGY